MVLSLRKKVNIKVRQPLNKILIPVDDAYTKEHIEAVKHLILSETNVKEIEYIHDTAGIASKKIKANFKSLGKKVGGMMKEVAEKIGQLSQSDINLLQGSGKFLLHTSSSPIEITLDDVEITTEDIPGWTVNTDGKYTVALDITINEALKQEGIARELVNRVQNLRKDKGFEVTDRIHVKLKKQDIITPSVVSNKEYICAEILAGSLEMVDSLETPAAVEIEVDDDIKTLIQIERI